MKMFATVVFVFCLIPLSASAEQRADVERVVSVLSQDGFSPSRLVVNDQTDRPVGALVDVVENGTVDSTIRSRAIQTLALYANDEQARTFVNELMEVAHPNQRTFPAVLLAFAELEGEASVPQVERFLVHPSASVRMAAVVALGRFGGDPGASSLRRLRYTEDDRTVVDRIDWYLN